jgi:ADP-ribose pyrophosphatase YjhB (NUDIX family)
MAMPSEGPRATVDVVIEVDGGIVLIRRRHPPEGWAIPGGFIDAGESAEDAARREMREETSLDVELVALLGVYSDPRRDPRGHTISAVYVGRGRGHPCADDDAADVGVFDEANLPQPLAFDHARILADYFRYRRTGERF